MRFAYSAPIVLRRSTAPPTATPVASRGIGERLGNQATARLLGGTYRIGAPHDAYERQARSNAESVMRGSGPPVQRDAGSRGAAPQPSMGRLGAGRELDAPVRGYFERRFGRSFDDVRVHTDARAAEAAASVGARAFTVRNHVLFGDGEYAPHTADGRRLLAHELTHVVQQGSMHEPVIQRELVYAGGYPRRFHSDAAEVGCYTSRPKCEWFPATIDFRATATGSGGGTAISTFTDLLDHIEAASPGSITELGLIGHANQSYFGLGGTIDAHNVTFSDAGLIGVESLAQERDRIAKLQDRFAKGAVITLYGCNAGAGKALLDAISNAFHVCVRGFTNEVVTCLQWHTPSLKIFSRGRTWVARDFLDRPEDVGCANFHANVRDLVPDQESCAGVPPVVVPKTTGEPARRWGVGAGGGAALSDEGWQAAVDLGLRYSLRSDRVIVVDPALGAHLLYLPSSGDRSSHLAAAIAEIGVRVQQPVRGIYADVSAGVYAGLQVPASTASGSTSAIGGFTAAAGVGYRWERLSIGPQVRGLIGGGPNHLIVIGAGTLYW